MSWYVYIAEARTRAYYVGITTDPAKRIFKHNSGDGARMAAQQGPFVLRYVSNQFKTKAEARTREAQIKRWTRAKKERLIEGEWQ
ncbi:GIY-YIG nuclease family protein [Candidatus Kaiserbacteria bacterium]|nr:GIY-YIG nuclease family protein [Candidatus Kaiserbacteria bacterium]